MNRRKLKIEPMEEHCGKPVTKAMIRLKGRRLKEAGFDPGEHVEVIIDRSGEIVLRRNGHPPAATEPPAPHQSLLKLDAL